mmetsp:Transcript_58518/g.154093  ORF Transcript_58518/g.154093 Transcript_58518/m.154093 type:complete len:804 (+) Transcript_58518:75-2486(+)
MAKPKAAAKPKSGGALDFKKTLFKQAEASQASASQAATPERPGESSAPEETPSTKKRRTDKGAAAAGEPAEPKAEQKGLFQKAEARSAADPAAAAASAAAEAANRNEPLSTNYHAANGDTGAMSLWIVPPGADPKALSSPAYDPALLLTEYPIGKPVGFALFSGALTEIENLKGSGKGSRKTSTVVLTNMFRQVLYSRPQDLVPTIYILCNKVAPDYEEAELGVGDGLLMKTICEVFGRSEAHIKNSMAAGEAKDLGEVALLSRMAQKVLMMPPKLSIEKVFSEMKAIANSAGKDSMKAKKDKIQKMLVASRGEEAKFLVRMLQAKLRIGIQIPTLLQALAYCFCLTRPAHDGAAPVADSRRGQGKIGCAQLEEMMVCMEAAVRQAFSEMPNFDYLVKALMEGRDGKTLLEVCHISMGIPVKPMLAKPSKGIAEVAERLNGKRFTGEWKYDGERAQIHVLSRNPDVIKVYSRNSENMTEKYPDVIKVIQETLCEGIESCIIDSELVAFDQETKKIMPFQVLSTRGRKNIQVEDIKVNVCVFAFDCMLCNGQPLVKQTLETRRQKLWTMLKETEGKVKFATYKNFEADENGVNEEEIQEFLDESIAGSCEGLMLKTLVDSATYEPSKRSLNWLKLKKDYLDGLGDSIDVVPIGAFYGKGKRTGSFGAFLLAIWNAEEEEYQTVCKAGTGFSDEDLKQHYEFYKGRALPKAESNYNVNDKVAPDVWLEACQVWEIKCADLSVSPVHTSAFNAKADGKGIGLRFPRFLRIRDDKSPEDSTGADQIVEMYEAQASVSKDGPVDDDDF